jgi:hypothetical protein
LAPAELLCRYHHTHFLQKGWSCRINAPTGYPNGSRRAGSTKINDPTSTPASGGCMLNDDSTATTDGNEHSQWHDRVRAED